MADDKTKEFLSRVLPWPSCDEFGRYTGCVHLWWTAVNPKAKKGVSWRHKTYTDIDRFLSGLDWVLTVPEFRDVYFCTSLQKDSSTTLTTGPISKLNGSTNVRSAASAIALKSIWLDLDVVTPGKQKNKDEYPTIEAAADALADFVLRSGIVSPSAVVGSGGGLQVYWTFSESLSPGTWSNFSSRLRQLAQLYSLLCDFGCTIDAARLLRVPGTFNWKTGTKRPTRVLGLGKNYTAEQLDACLPKLVTGAVTRKPNEETNSVGRPSQKFFDFIGGSHPESLALGCEREYAPLDLGNIFRGCRFLGHALSTGGRDFDNTLWNLTTLCTTFFEKGELWAHELSKGHKDYTYQETSEMYARKVRERDAKRLGWPSCATIAASGSRFCTGCPHFTRGKSPLNLGTDTGTSVSNVSKSVVQAATSALNLPDGYVIDSDGYICAMRKIDAGKDQPPDEVLVRLFQKKFTNPWTQKHPDAINFTTTLDKGHTGPASVEAMALVSTIDLTKSLLSQGILVDPAGEKYVRPFMNSWLGKLQNAQESISCRPFGWIRSSDKGREGFVYGGIAFRSDGTKTTSGYSEASLRNIYCPQGSPKTWIECCRLITDRERPDLDCLVASGFAAPLITFSGQYAVLLSVYGTSGRGKSSAVAVGAGVWGNPKLSKEVKDTSSKYMLRKTGDLQSLPSYWDEMSVERQKNVYEVYTTLSEGKEGGKLKSDRSYAKIGDWETMMIVTSNHSFNDLVVLKSKDSSAGLYRVFEYKVLEGDAKDGLISETEAMRKLAELNLNCGHVGMAYAEYLATHINEVDNFVMDCINDIRNEVFHKTNSLHLAQAERYWPAAAGTLLAAGTYANRFGAQIDTRRLRAFLLETYFSNRARVREEALDGGTMASTEDQLAAFLKTYMENTLWTDVFTVGRGTKTILNILHGPDRRRPMGIYVHWAVAERKVRVSRSEFFKFIGQGQSPSVFMIQGLKDHFGATITRAILGAGTPYGTVTEWVIEMNVPPGSVLEGEMMAHAHDIK